MHFLADNWYWFIIVWASLLALYVLSFIKISKRAMNDDIDENGIFKFVASSIILGLLVFLSSIFSVISIILAIIKFVQTN